MLLYFTAGSPVSEVAVPNISLYLALVTTPKESTFIFWAVNILIEPPPDAHPYPLYPDFPAPPFVVIVPLFSYSPAYIVNNPPVPLLDPYPADPPGFPAPPASSRPPFPPWPPFGLPADETAEPVPPEYDVPVPPILEPYVHPPPVCLSDTSEVAPGAAPVADTASYVWSVFFHK